AQMEDLIEGHKGTHAGGIRYPITQFMEYEAKLPPRYMEANRVWDVEHGRAQYTPRDRGVAAYKRSFADRVPVYPIVASFAGTLDGVSIEEYCTNVPRATTALLDYYERAHRGGAPGCLRGPASHAWPHADRGRVPQELGRRHRGHRHRAQRLGPHRPDQPDLARQLPGVHRPLPHGARGLPQGEQGRRDDTHLW